ncbi:cytochrome P450 [Methylobacterium oxalidis]|uniref:cytochrome P450 n=1 Tax=Methylobacterium oxalidis TaxID=944322 RepID=UPI0033149CAF
MLAEVLEKAPSSDYDPYEDEALLAPWEGYRTLQDAGPAVWLTRHEMFALTRYDSVKNALQDWEAFPSSLGVMMNEEMNQVLRGNTLCSDGDAHDRLRRVVARPLTPSALKSLQEEVDREAKAVVDRICSQGRFCAVADLATHLPVTIVSRAVGLPEKGRERMLDWSYGMFNCFGPANDRMRTSLPVLSEMMDYARNHAVIGNLKPGSWAEALHEAAARGEVPPEVVPVMMIDYFGPSLDTTIFGTANAVWLFAKNPDQWDLVREDPSLIPSAINEALRMEAPIQDFGRYVARDYDMDGIRLPEGSRVIVFYGAANRDPRRFADPDRFDIRRNATGHMAFGAGPHMCVGMNLARLEMRALFNQLARRVKRFHVEVEERALHNILRGFKRLVVSVE